MNWFSIITGAFLILLGLSMILHVFGIHLPLMRAAAAFGEIKIEN